MSLQKTANLIKFLVLVTFLGLSLAPVNARADDGKEGGGGKESSDKHEGGGDGHEGEGGGGSVPVNGGIAILTLAGVAYCAKRFYDLRKQKNLVA